MTGLTARMLSLSIMVLLVVCGCTTTQYMEQQTPAGQVPPLPPQQSSIAPPGPSPVQAIALKNESARSVDPASGTIERFKQAYQANKSPRIVVLLNRELSDEVREWVTDSRLQMQGGFTETKAVEGKKTEQTDMAAALSISAQRQAETGQRLSPGEAWMWAFEDGFITPFLQSSAKVVDRATIMRLEASSGQESSVYAPVSIKKVEMNALKKHSDIFIEILIVRSPSSLYGYEFKASAKDIHSGIIIANVTSLRWHPEDRKKREVVPTSHGYELKESTKIPPVEEIASDLSIDLMNAMMRAWSK